MDENAFAYKTEGHRHRPEIEQELAALGSETPVTFVPHLLPLDQGELTSCYAQLSEPISKEEVQALYAERYAGEPFVHAVDRPPGLRDVRDTNECHVYVTVEERGRVLAFSAIDNLWKGASGQAVQNLNLMLGLRRDEGLRVSGAADAFFRSRWVDPPAGVEQLDPAQLAPGFRAGAAHCGLKGGGKTDVGLLVCDAPQVSSSVLLTRNASAAAPVRVCRQRVDRGAVRAAVVNAGNANAETGEQGFADAWAMCERAGAELGLDPSAVAVAETGVIGVPLPIDAVLAGSARPPARCPPRAAAPSPMRSSPPIAGRRAARLRAGGVTLSAQAKGAGMMQPDFATMLCFVQTDAVVEDADAALRGAVDASFERITVDGQMSTNDTVLLQATGEAGAPLPDGAAGGGAAAARARDRRRRRGRRPGRPRRRWTAPPRRGGRAGRPRDRQLAAGQDRALRPRPQLGPDRAGGGDGPGRRGPRGDRRRLDRRRRARRGDRRGGDRAATGPRRDSAHVWFSDLGYEYVRINAEYTT